MDYNGYLRGYNISVVPPDDAYRLSLIVRTVNVFLYSISIWRYTIHYGDTHAIILKTIDRRFFFFFFVKHIVII